MRRKRPTAWGALIGATVVVALGVVGWQASDLGRASRDLARQRAAARREGVPIEYDDLRRLEPSVPEADNAAVPYGRAFATLQAEGNFRGVKADDLLKAIPLGTAKPGDVAALRTALAAAAPALSEIEEGSRRKGYSFDRQWERGVNLLFPEFAYARSAGRALVLRAMLATDPAEAGKDLRTAARLRAHVGSEPFFISPLVGSSMEGAVEQGVRYLGARGGAWAEAARPALDDLGPVPDLRRVLAGESVFGRKEIDDLAKTDWSTTSPMGNDDYKPPVMFRFARFGPVRDAFEARTLEHWRKVYAALPKDPLDWRAAKAATDLPIPEGPSEAMLELTAPVFGGIGDLAARLEAERRLSRAALDLWEGRPPTLAKDPFGTGPLRLSGGGRSWTLWSLGPDGVDNGGKAKAKESDASYDLVVKSP